MAHVTPAARLQLTVELEFCRCEHDAFTRTRGCVWHRRALKPHPQCGLHSPISLWCAVPTTRVVRPMTSGDTINTERYQNLLIHLIYVLEGYEKHCWFQRDAATSPLKTQQLHLLRHFGDGILGRGRRPSNFFLYKFLKQ